MPAWRPATSAASAAFATSGSRRYLHSGRTPFSQLPTTPPRGVKSSSPRSPCDASCNVLLTDSEDMRSGSITQANSQSTALPATQSTTERVRKKSAVSAAALAGDTHTTSHGEVSSAKDNGLTAVRAKRFNYATRAADKTLSTSSTAQSPPENFPGRLLSPAYPVSPSLTEEDVRRSRFQEAARRLHLQTTQEIPGREAELAEIRDVVFQFLKAGERVTGSLYICGMPGTGKTATLRVVLETAKQKFSSKWNLIFVNGFEVTTPEGIFKGIVEQLGLKASATAAAARHTAAKYFTSAPRKSLLVIDEADYLLTHGERVLYEIYEWIGNPRAKLFITAISNTIQLNISSRLQSRMGGNRIVFKPYSMDQLLRILLRRIEDANLFDAPALKFCARRVANTSGDARAALHVARRALELAACSSHAAVSMEDVSRSFQENSAMTLLDDVLRHIPPVCWVALAILLVSVRGNNGVLTMARMRATSVPDCYPQVKAVLTSETFVRALRTLAEAGIVELANEQNDDCIFDDYANITLNAAVNKDVLRKSLDTITGGKNAYYPSGKNANEARHICRKLLLL